MNMYHYPIQHFLPLLVIPTAALLCAEPDLSRFNPNTYFPGVNLAVAEFGKGSVLNKDYTYPKDSEFTYFHDKGLKIIRIPFKWERIQRKVMGELSAPDLAELDRCVTVAGKLELVVLLDVHNYGGREVNGKKALVGVDAELSVEAFADLWSKLAAHFKDNPLVWYGLMNEPHGVSAEINAANMQAALKAVRAVGAKNRVLVAGTAYSGAHSWVKSGNAAAFENFSDSENNFAFEPHQYLDKDNSGTHAEAIAGAGSTRLVAFTEWARAHKFKALLGEFGWDNSPANTQGGVEGEALLSYMDQNNDVWMGYTYWAAGPWWSKYMYCLEPEGLKEGAPIDRPQMSIILRHLK